MRISYWSSDVCSSDLGFFPENTNRVNFDRPQEVGYKYYYVMANVSYDFDAFTLTSITGYLSSDQFLLGDIDGSSHDYFYESDRKSVVSGKGVSVRVDFGGGRFIKKKKVKVHKK